jgi:hypothetical protein
MVTREGHVHGAPVLASGITEVIGMRNGTGREADPGRALRQSKVLAWEGLGEGLRGTVTPAMRIQ